MLACKRVAEIGIKTGVSYHIISPSELIANLPILHQFRRVKLNQVIALASSTLKQLVYINACTGARGRIRLDWIYFGCARKEILSGPGRRAVRRACKGGTSAPKLIEPPDSSG